MVGILHSLGSASKCLPLLPAVMPRLLHTSHHAQALQLRSVAVEQVRWPSPAPSRAFLDLL